jgi:hypothetical protein
MEWGVEAEEAVQLRRYAGGTLRTRLGIRVNRVLTNGPRQDRAWYH